MEENSRTFQGLTQKFKDFSRKNWTCKIAVLDLFQTCSITVPCKNVYMYAVCNLSCNCVALTSGRDAKLHVHRVHVSTTCTVYIHMKLSWKRNNSNFAVLEIREIHVCTCSNAKIEIANNFNF